MTSRSAKSSLGVAAVVGLTIVAMVSCSRAPARSDVGSVVIGALQLAPGQTFRQVTYLITSSNGTAINGIIDVTNAQTATALVSGIPATPSPYFIAMDAETAGAQTICRGTGTFVVSARQTTIVNIVLQCHGPFVDRGGAIAINGRLDNCPFIQSFGASSLEASVGDSIAISVVSTDLDTSDRVSTQWTASPAGVVTIANSLAAQTSVTCTAVGATTLSVAVSDGFCSDNRTSAIPINCLAGPGSGMGGAGMGGSGMGGMGVGGSGVGGSAGEQACQVIPSGAPSCSSCTTDNCALAPSPQGSDGCCGLTNAADVALCMAVVDCYQTNADQCVVDGDPTLCFCGTSRITCFDGEGGANGPCLQQVYAAAKTTDPAVVRSLFTSGASPLGRATNLVACRGAFCPTECALNGLTGAAGASGSTCPGLGGQGGAGGGTPGGTECADDTSLLDGSAACVQCTIENCALAPPSEGGTDGCCGLSNDTDIDLCRAVVSCIETASPACTLSGDATRCFCGTSGATCFGNSGSANGPCVQQVIAAAKSSAGCAIRSRFTDPSSPLGRAVDLIACRGTVCATECGIQ